MEKFTTHTGIAAPLKRSNVDTDQIIPAVYLKRVTKTGFEDALFAAWRQDPEFVLNQPVFQGASILVAGPDFGTGSSREHAVWALRDFGFQVVLSPRFADIFRGNSGKQGLLTGVISEADLERIWAAIDADPGIRMTVDLERARARASAISGFLSTSMITLGGGFSKGSTTSGSPCATKTRSRSSRLAARRGGRGPSRFRRLGRPPQCCTRGGQLTAVPSKTQVRFHRMKTLLGDVQQMSKAGDQELSGEDLAIRGGRPLSAAASRSRVRRTSRPRPWSPRCWARRPACCATSPTSATSRSSGRCSRCTA